MLNQKTVNTYQVRIMKKLEVKKKKELVEEKYDLAFSDIKEAKKVKSPNHRSIHKPIIIAKIDEPMCAANARRRRRCMPTTTRSGRLIKSIF